MNGDLTRVTFDPLRHFTRVVMQQGRVQLDADWNEQVAILLHYLQALAADLIGPHGGPDDLFSNPGQRTGIIRRNCGFAILSAKTAVEIDAIPLLTNAEKEELKLSLAKTGSVGLAISTGHYYVDGRLCENDKHQLYSDQQDLPAQPLDLNKSDLLYLDVWERPLTSLEAPGIREVALGGADTSARARLVWQVKNIGPELFSRRIGGQTINCETVDTVWNSIVNELRPPNRGQLRADAKMPETTDPESPCAISPEARFRGTENLLYRVEIHRSGVAFNDANANVAATFKWSRENATVVAALKQVKGDNLFVSGMRDNSRWFAAGDWVELTHDALELQGKEGIMARLAKVDGEVLTIAAATKSGDIFDLNGPNKPGNPKVRRWDHKEIAHSKNLDETKLNQGALLIQEGAGDQNWIELEGGVQIQFKPLTNGQHKYRTGDYWLIPARVATGDVEWPVNPAGESLFLPPAGIEHHYAPLAVIAVAAGGPTIIDLRRKFPAAGKC